MRTRAISGAEVVFSHSGNADYLTAVRKSLKGRMSEDFQEKLLAQLITPSACIGTGGVRHPSARGVTRTCYVSPMRSGTPPNASRLLSSLVTQMWPS